MLNVRRGCSALRVGSSLVVTRGNVAAHSESFVALSAYPPCDRVWPSLFALSLASLARRVLIQRVAPLMAPSLKPIEHKSARWEPTPDAKDILVPGLDTTASVNDQIEQIEQLITIKLQVCLVCTFLLLMPESYQNVDANFSRIQQIMANRILPAVKRYAVGTEPVREAAKVRVFCVNLHSH